MWLYEVIPEHVAYARHPRRCFLRRHPADWQLPRLSFGNPSPTEELATAPLAERFYEVTRSTLLFVDLATVSQLLFCGLVPFPFLLVATGSWRYTDTDVAVTQPLLYHSLDNILLAEDLAYSRCISNPTACCKEDESRCSAAAAADYL